MPRALTHEGEFKARGEVLDQFLDEVRGLGDKLAVLLVQLPPKLEFERRVANRFFKAVQRRTNVPLVCEPRHPSWGSKQAHGLLNDCSVARVAADPPLWPTADEPGGWHGLVYFRWHGQPRKYYSEYGAECLAKLEAQVAASAAAQVWAIFDNTAHGYGLDNALTVSDAIAHKRKGMPPK